MILGSEEDEEVVTLDESSITSILAGAGVTITRTTGSSSSAPRKTATVENSSSETTTPKRRPANSAPSDCVVAPPQQLTAKKKEKKEVDPLDLSDDDMEMEFDKMDNLREMLAKSSVAITYQVTIQNKSVSELKSWPFLSMSPFHTMSLCDDQCVSQGHRSRPVGKPAKVMEKNRSKEMTRSLSTPKLPSKIVPRAVKGSPQLQRSLSGALVRSDPKLAINSSSAKATIKPFGNKMQTPKLKAKPLVKTPLRSTPKRPLQAEKPKPVPQVPKIIDRGPVDCCDSLIVETDMGFPCNFCEVSRLS